MEVKFKKKVLVVDDDRVTCKLLGHILDSRGFEVITASTGPRGLKSAAKHLPDIILLDLFLPELDGFEVCRRLQQNPSTKSIPIIMMTSGLQREKKLKGLELGAIDFIRKPIDKLEIIARVKSNVNFREIQRTLEKKQREIERDLELAKLFQRSLLPERFPDSKQWRFHGRYMPSGRVGGDLYDVMALDNGCLGVLMADVSGHGVHAALIVSMVKALMTTHAKKSTSPGETIRTLNNLLVDMLPDDTFVTLFYGITCPGERVVRYTLAGHPTPVHIRRNGEIISSQEIKNSVAGAFRDETYEEGVMECVPGDRLLIYTDGVTDVMNPEGEPFAMQGLRNSLSLAGPQPLEELDKIICREIDAFRQGREIDDDIAILLMEAV